MLRHQCSIYDIDDIEAFIVMCIKRSGCRPTYSEWEDLIATGIMLLWEMSNNYKVGIGTFSGYAIRYMPKKLKESYHRSHENYIRSVDDGGRRQWTRKQTALSWDEMTTVDDSHHIDETKLRYPGNFINPH